VQRRSLLQAAPLLLTPTLSLAQAYPAKPIRYVVPVAPGGGADTIGRAVSDRWGKVLGQTEEPR
jgi:tripartite-type tricarboxylate transporter receptor subunit TctC